MSIPGAGSGGNFFEQILGDLLNLMGPQTSEQGRVELARTLAQGVATGGSPEGNVDPADRIQFEQLAHVAELHVGELTGLRVTPTGAPVEVRAVGPGAWAWQTVEDWRFLLEAMAAAAPGTGAGQGPGGPPPTGAPDEGEARGAASGRGGGPDDAGLPEGLGLTDLGPVGGPPAGPGDLVARWLSTMGPMLAAMQLGSAVGHLARSTMGAYELPVPRPGAGLLVIPANATRFADDWSLPADEVRLWVCLRELTTHAVLSRPHVAARLTGLLTEVVQGMAEDAGTLVDRLQGMDLSSPDSLQELLGDPSSFMALEPSPARRRAADDVMAVVAALLGYVEHVLDVAGGRLLGARGAITEAWRRHLVDREDAQRAAEGMVGLDLGPAQIDRGAAFVRGVLERAGDSGLARLWAEARTLPTPAEVDAPGLWLERTELGADPGA